MVKFSRFFFTFVKIKSQQNNISSYGYIYEINVHYYCSILLMQVY